MQCRSAMIIVMLLLCEESFAQVFKCKDPVTWQTTFTDKSCGTSGQREYVPLHQTNEIKSPDRSSQFQSRGVESRGSGPNIVIIDSDSSVDNYKRQRRLYEMQAENARSIPDRISARDNLRALDEQYKTSQGLSGSDRQNYDRESTRLRHGLDNSRSIPERISARRGVADLNHQHGGQDPFPKSNGTGATTIPVTPAPPSVITHCDPGHGGVCHDNLGGVYIKAGPNVLVPATGGHACTRSGGVVVCPP